MFGVAGISFSMYFLSMFLYVTLWMCLYVLYVCNCMSGNLYGNNSLHV